MSEPPVVRPAGPADAEALGRLQLDCWRDAYEGVVDPVRLAVDLGAVDVAVARWRAVLDGPGVVRLAAEGGRLVGFAAVRPAGAAAPAELAAVYVRRSHWSTGLGQRLLDASLGRQPATLRVHRDNARARSFYARNGFVPDGTEVEEPHWGGVEIGMVRPAP